MFQEFLTDERSRTRKGDVLEVRTKNHFRNILLLVACAPFLMALKCSKDEDAADTGSGGGGSAAKYLYVSSGFCYSGNAYTTFTTATASNLVFRVNISTGAQEYIADYNGLPSNAGDSPVSIANVDSNTIAVLVENATAALRRIELVEKKNNGTRTTYNSNATAFSAVLRSMYRQSDGNYLVSKSSAVEKVRDTATRFLGGGAGPWINAPAAPCATSTTLISDILRIPSGLHIFAHAAASQARVAVIGSSGYVAAGDCEAAQSAPHASAFPTAMVYDEANSKLLVAYAHYNATPAAEYNSIYAYSVNETTGAISSPQKIYDYFSGWGYSVYAISEMTLDAQTNQLYVATASGNTAAVVNNYRIERFTYTPSLIGVTNSAVLVKDSDPFYDYGFDTKCISGMFVAD